MAGLKSRTVQTVVIVLVIIGLIALALGGYLTPLSRYVLAPVIGAQTWLATKIPNLFMLQESGIYYLRVKPKPSRQSGESLKTDNFNVASKRMRLRIREERSGWPKRQGLPDEIPSEGFHRSLQTPKTFGPFPPRPAVYLRHEVHRRGCRYSHVGELARPQRRR